MHVRVYGLDLGFANMYSWDPLSIESHAHAKAHLLAHRICNARSYLSTRTYSWKAISKWSSTAIWCGLKRRGDKASQ